MEFGTLESLLEFIEENFTIDIQSSIVTNVLNQPMVKIAIMKIGYSIVDNGNDTFDVGVLGVDNILTFEGITADEVIGVITTYSNKQLLMIMNDRNAIKHGIFID